MYTVDNKSEDIFDLILSDSCKDFVLFFRKIVHYFLIFPNQTLGIFSDCGGKLMATIFVEQEE